MIVYQIRDKISGGYLSSWRDARPSPQNICPVYKTPKHARRTIARLWEDKEDAWKVNMVKLDDDCITQDRAEIVQVELITVGVVDG